jgi:ATP-binding cassette subfamily B multidrug efflux pump
VLLALIVVANLVVIFTKASASAARVNEVFDTHNSVIDQPDPGAWPETGAPRVAFEHVRFGYGGEAELEDIELTVMPGERLGIIGGTGAGKSTLISLIPRFYDVTGGCVRVDGVDVRAMPINSLRARIGIVPQNAVLFTGTIRDNMRWRKPDATDQQIWKALETAQAAGFIRQHPEGLDAPVNQGGRNFSGGQRQRLTIARALVGDPDILILDDSASALDYATDAALRQALADQAGGMTLFMVSQRVHTVRGCDRILVLDEGRIAGLGTHEALLEGCPVYQEICASQLSDEEVS